MCKICEIPSLWHAPGERYISVPTLNPGRFDVIDTRTDSLVAVGIGPLGAAKLIGRLNIGRPTASVFGGIPNEV